jgi:AraC-type DNA-binding domain-containing proteins
LPLSAKKHIEVYERKLYVALPKNGLLENKPEIEIHQSESKGLGLHVKKIYDTSGDFTEKVRYPHRDEHYIFYLQREGCTELMIDFKNYQVNDNCLFFICPGQVHCYIGQRHSKGYFIFLDPSYLQNEYRRVFEDYQNMNQTISVQQEALFTTMELLADQFPAIDNDIEENITRSLSDAFMGMVVSEFLKNEKQYQKIENRRTEILTRFRRQVRSHFKQLKRPKDYASMLHISVPYLNEITKEQTGYTASYWLQQEILLEAKRLLYYTQLSSKEIAFSLGYQDYTYFSRFFKKNVGVSPLEFRNNYYDLSNKRF